MKVDKKFQTGFIDRNSEIFKQAQEVISPEKVTNLLILQCFSKINLSFFLQSETLRCLSKWETKL